MTEPDPEDKLRIIFMCTGNQARSVIAEHYTRKIASDLPVVTESVGLLATAGAPALPGAVEVGRKLELDLSASRQRRALSI